MLIDEIKSILKETLQLDDNVKKLGANSILLGSVPELDSMAVVNIITTLEDRYGFIVDDDEISAETFETLGSLVNFVQSKLDE